MIIRMAGEYDVHIFNAMDGSIQPIEYKWENKETVVRHNYCIMDGILLRFQPAGQAVVTKKEVKEKGVAAVWNNSMDPVPVQLSEPNVYMLDLAEYAVDEEEFSTTEEVLRIGVAMREKYGITPQSGRMAQPWTREKTVPEHTLNLRYTVESEIVVENPVLALEHGEDTVVYVNGERVNSAICGYYVDEKIKTIPLPSLKKGKNIIQLIVPFGEGTDVENSFLLGDFGVHVCGMKQTITEPVTKLAFGDITTQGLPFYGGNITYQIPVEADDHIKVKVPYFRGSCIGVSIDGEREGSIFLPPYTFETSVKPGKHQIGLTLFGNRINTFGGIHNCNENTTWWGPDAWRTQGDSYSYEYCLKKVGILKRPDIG